MARIEDRGLHAVELGRLDEVVLADRDIDRVAVHVEVAERIRVRPVLVLVPPLHEGADDAVHRGSRLERPAPIGTLGLEGGGIDHRAAQKQPDGHAAHGETDLHY